MRILAVLCTVLLVRLCNCEDDSKVDSSLLDLEESLEDNIKVLKLTPKGDKATKLVYDGNEIWSGKARLSKSSYLVEAMLYFNEETPALATIKTIKGGKESTIYRYNDGSKWQNDKEDDHKKKLGALKEDCKPVDKPEENPPVSSTPLEQNTLDISRVDQSNLEYFEYTHDDNLTQLIVPKKGVSVQKIVRGGDTVWTPPSGEKFEYTKLFLDENRKLGLILITSNVSSEIKYNYFIKNGSKWEHTAEYAKKMNAIKVVPASKTDMSIDLEGEEDTDECRLIDVELLNVSTHFYLPKPEYHSNNVRSGEDVLWEAKGGERCKSCAVYSKNGNHLLSLFIKDGDKSDYKHFEKADGTWSFISEEEFNKKYKNMQVTASQTSGDATFTESKEVDKEEPDQQSGDSAAGPVTDPQESWDTKSESSTNDPSYQSPTEESVLVGSDKNEETATEHEDIPHQSFSSHSDEQSGSDDSASQDTESSENATVDQNEQATTVLDSSQPDANTETNEQPEVTPSETSTLDLANPDDSNVYTYNGDDKRNVVEASEKGEESTTPLSIDGNTETKCFENSTEWSNHSNERSSGQESHNLGTSELRGSRASIDSRKEDCRDSTISTVSTASTRSTLSSNQTDGSTTLKLAKPDDSIYQSFEYYHDDNHIKLIVPQEGVTVAKLLDSRFAVWTGKTGETLEYAKVYLKKDGKHGFVRVWKRDHSGVTCINYTTGRVYGWSEFKGDISTKINPLKVPVERKGDFVIDLKKDGDTDDCRVFSVNFLGVPTRSYFPKPGNVAKEVMDRDKSLWRASECTDERCLSCDIYTKDEQRILSITKKKDDKTDDAFFEFSDGEWKHITEEEFDRKFQVMINGPSQESTDSLDTRKVENESLPSGEVEDANSISTSSDSVDGLTVESSEPKVDTHEETPDDKPTEATEEPEQTNQQESCDTQTSSQPVISPEDKDAVNKASEGEVELEKEDDREYKEPISATEDVIQNSEKSTLSENAALEEANSESSISSDKTPVESDTPENGADSSESFTDGPSNEVSTDGFSDRANEMMKEATQEIADSTLKTVEDNNTTGVSDSAQFTQEDKEQSNVSDTQSNEDLKPEEHAHLETLPSNHTEHAEEAQPEEEMTPKENEVKENEPEPTHTEYSKKHLKGTSPKDVTELQEASKQVASVGQLQKPVQPPLQVAKQGTQAKSGDAPSPVQTNGQTPPKSPTQPQVNASPSTPPLANTTSSITSQAGAPKPTVPCVLDLANPDESNVDIVKGGSNGVNYRGFMPKNSSVTSVVYAGATVWTATGDEKCTGGNMYGKDDSLLLDVTITTGDKFNVKYFEKNGTESWKNMEQNDFLKKLHEMRNGVTNQPSVESSQESPNPSTSNSSTTNQPSESH